MENYINYNSRNLEEWIAIALLKIVLSALCLLTTKKNIYSDSNAVRIEAADNNYEFYQDVDIKTGAISKDIRVNNIPAKIFCSIDCNNIDKAILTDTYFSLSIIKIIQPGLVGLLANFCCSNIECTKSIHQELISDIEIDQDNIFIGDTNSSYLQQSE